MRLPAWVLFFPLFFLALGCGPRNIEKQQVPRADEIQAIRLMAEGDQLLEEGKDHLAMLKYLEASEFNPYYEIIFNKLAVAYSRLQMFFQAGEAVDRAIALNPDYSYAYNTRGLIALARADPGKAVDAMEQAIELDPGVASFYLNYGYALVQEGEAGKAASAYRRAVELDPNIFQDKEFLEVNFASADQVIDPEKYYTLARLHAQLGNLELCLDYLGKAFAAGFSDYERIAADPAFDEMVSEEDFQRFLRIHGVSL